MIFLAGGTDGLFAGIGFLDLVNDLPALPAREKVAGDSGVGLAAAIVRVVVVAALKVFERSVGNVETGHFYLRFCVSQALVPDKENKSLTTGVGLNAHDRGKLAV